jgi:hypothetical protein
VHYNAVNSKLREVAKVKLLAASGVPKLHSLPLTTKGYVVPKLAVQEQERSSDTV